jgi:hypothetical protein
VDIVDVFTDRYQATHVPSRDRFIATVLHATVSTNHHTGHIKLPECNKLLMIHDSIKKGLLL